MVPISSPLTPLMGEAMKAEKKGVVSKPLTVQAIKKDIRQVGNMKYSFIHASMIPYFIVLFSKSSII